MWRNLGAVNAMCAYVNFSLSQEVGTPSRSAEMNALVGSTGAQWGHTDTQNILFLYVHIQPYK